MRRRRRLAADWNDGFSSDDTAPSKRRGDLCFDLLFCFVFSQKKILNIFQFFPIVLVLSPLPILENSPKLHFAHQRRILRRGAYDSNAKRSRQSNHRLRKTSTGCPSTTTTTNSCQPKTSTTTRVTKLSFQQLVSVVVKTIALCNLFPKRKEVGLKAQVKCLKHITRFVFLFFR